MTHVLLTRSPLSPGPKGWFSLDLHVLSAPPAFVLSQDQTLRERVVSARRRKLSLRACAQSRSLERDQTGFSSHPARRSGPSRSRRKRTLLSFQRPSPPGDVKKPPTTRARGPQMLGSLRIRLRPKALQCRGAGTLLRRPSGQPENDSNVGAPVKKP